MLILLAAGVVSGCQYPGQGNQESDNTSQQVLRIGVSLPSPGLISGISPDDVSGIEVDLAVAIAKELELVSGARDIAWVPMRSDAMADGLASGDLDFALGQLQPAEPSDAVAWVGPYVEATAGLLVRNDSEDATPDASAPFANTVVTSLADLNDSTVCVVDGSAADGTTFSAAEAIPQRTVSECETGMRSGRYDAVAADDLQLAGILSDTSGTEEYQLLQWSQLPDAQNDQMVHHQYWIGTTQQHCDATSAALQQLADDGTLEGLLNRWDESLNFTPKLVQAEDISAKFCG